MVSSTYKKITVTPFINKKYLNKLIKLKYFLFINNSFFDQ
jgi:hypothetical protein